MSSSVVFIDIAITVFIQRLCLFMRLRSQPYRGSLEPIKLHLLHCQLHLKE